jgi:predicted GNAT family N-acyltransferase
VIRVERVDWANAQETLKNIRHDVFVLEQQVSAEDEWDGLDETAVHFLAVDELSGQAVGTARFLLSGKITRMAVRLPYRQRGVGSHLLTAVLRNAADCGFQRVYLDAQTSALGFYRKFGFIPEGDVFWDAGIEHIRMTKDDPGKLDDF